MFTALAAAVTARPISLPAGARADPKQLRTNYLTPHLLPVTSARGGGADDPPVPDPVAAPPPPAGGGRHGRRPAAPPGPGRAEGRCRAAARGRRRPARGHPPERVQLG